LTPRTLHARVAVGRTEGSPAQTGQVRILRKQLLERSGARTHFLRIGQRPHHEGPQGIGRTIPAEPVLQTDIEQTLGIAIERAAMGGRAARATICKAQVGPVAAGTRALSIGRQPRVVEQPSPEFDGCRMS